MMFSPHHKIQPSQLRFASEPPRQSFQQSSEERTDTSVGNPVREQVQNGRIIRLIRYRTALLRALRQCLVSPKCFLQMWFDFAQSCHVFLFLCSRNICFPQNSNDAMQGVPIFALTVKILVLLASNHLADSASFAQHM